MKDKSWIFGLVILLLAGLSLLPGLQAYAKALVGFAALLAMAQTIVGLIGKESPAQPAAASTTMAPAPAVKPVISQPAPRAEAEIVALLASLQEKGRLVDFLMDDITRYDDAQVGAAARVVHQGCATVLKEHFEIQPQVASAEGSSITVPAGHAADEYRLTGNLSGSAPFTGTLVHKGWKTAAVKLPHLIDDAKDRLPAIAPAEVEIR